MFPFGGPFGGGHPMMFGGGHPMLFGGGGGPPRVVVMGGHPMMGAHPMMGGHPLILGRPQIIAVPSSSSSSSSTSWRDMNSRHMGKKTLWHATSESASWEVNGSSFYESRTRTDQRRFRCPSESAAVQTDLWALRNYGAYYWPHTWL